MPVTNLGRIGIVPKGTWLAGTYKFLDLVSHEGGAYLCKAPTTTETPGVGADWQKLVTFVDGVFNDAEQSLFTGWSSTKIAGELLALSNSLPPGLSWVAPTTSATYTYTDGLLTGATDVIDGKNRVATYSYTDGVLTSAAIVYDGVTRTETYTYTNGVLTGISVTEV